MQARHPKVPDFDPKWQRTALITEIQATLSDPAKVNDMAIEVDPSLTGSLVTVCGTVEPAAYDPAGLYRNLRAGITALTLCGTPHVLFQAWGSLTARVPIDLHPTPESLDNLTQAHARNDSLMRDILAHTRFSRLVSKGNMRWLMRNLDCLSTDEPLRLQPKN